VPRYTKDLDLWIDPARPNAERAYAALARFGAPVAEVTVDDLCDPGCVLQIGIEPNRIDILTALADIPFAAAWERRTGSTYGDIGIDVIARADLILAKKAAGRPQDLLDIAWLERAEGRERKD
jgi:hypothetical protein